MNISQNFRLDGKVAFDGTTFFNRNNSNCIGEVDGVAFKKEFESSWNECSGVWVQEYRERVDHLKSLIPTEAMLTQVTVEPKYQFKNDVTCYAEVVSIQSRKIAYGFEGGELKYIEVTYANGHFVDYAAKFQAGYPDDVEQAVDEFKNYYQSYLT